MFWIFNWNANEAALEFEFKEIGSWHWTDVGLHYEFRMMIVIFLVLDLN